MIEVAALMLAYPVISTVAGLTVGSAAILAVAQPQPRKPRRFRIERIPVGKPKPLTPAAARVYGSRRRLAEQQRAWIEAEAAQQAQAAAPVSKEAGQAFASWFEARIVIPATPTLADVIAHDDWETDYTQYCDERGLPRLFGDDLFDYMDSYTRHYNCTLGSKGEVNGAHLGK
jgi:hypothetical protein